MIQALSSEVGKAVTLRMSRVVWLAVSVGLICSGVVMICAHGTFASDLFCDFVGDVLLVVMVADVPSVGRVAA